MLIYNLEKKQNEPNLEEYRNTDHYFIVANYNDIETIKDTLNIVSYAKSVYESINENIYFESTETYDFISFIYFKFQDAGFLFEKINLYHGSNYIVLVVDENNKLHRQAVEDLKLNQIKAKSEKDRLATIYYRLFSNALSKMFDSLCLYEELLTETEAEILKGTDECNFEKIVEMKGVSFQVKKYLRFLLHVGDQMTDNENKLIPAGMIKSFENLDLRINRLYEFSEGIHEMTEHLMDLYDSALTSETNNMINKLTLFTVFATPLTVISGIYGMNFINMPELQHKYGYFFILGVMASCLSVTYFILKKIKLL